MQIMAGRCSAAAAVADVVCVCRGRCLVVVMWSWSWSCGPGRGSSLYPGVSGLWAGVVPSSVQTGEALRRHLLVQTVKHTNGVTGSKVGHKAPPRSSC